MTHTVIMLPFPPSVNNLFPTGRGGKRFRSKAYETWIKEAWFHILQQKAPNFTDRVTLKIHIGPGRSNADCSNYIKAPEDFLVMAGIIQGDSKKYVKSVSIEWSDDVNGCMVEIEG